MNVLEVETAIYKTKEKKVLYMLWENSVHVVHCEGGEAQRERRSVISRRGLEKAL